MKFYRYLESIENFEFVFLLMFVIVIGASLVMSVANAEKDKVEIGADVSAKINGGKSGTQANASGNESVRVEENVSSSSGAKPQEEYHESTEAESHEHLKIAYEKLSADSDNTFTVQTERHLYKPGDGVKIEGTIWSGLIAAVGGINTVSIQVAGNNGNIVYNGIEHVSNGEYSATFELPTDTKNGAYTLQAKADVNADVLNSLTLKMQTGLDSTTKFVVVSPNAWEVKAGGKDFEVSVESSSDASDLKFDEQAKKLSLSVQGESGTTGVTDITIPKSLLSGDLTVMIDGQVMSQNDVIETADTQDDTTLEINYHHSSHVIDVVGTNAAPEFPVSTVIITVAVGSVIILGSFGKGLNKKSK